MSIERDLEDDTPELDDLSVFDGLGDVLGTFDDEDDDGDGDKVGLTDEEGLEYDEDGEADCPRCLGLSTELSGRPCRRCDGKGYVRRPEIDISEEEEGE